MRMDTMSASYRFEVAAVIAACLLTAGCAGEDSSSVKVPYVPLGLAAFDNSVPERTPGSAFLYISDSGTDDVQMYHWPKPSNPVATLTGFDEPQGLCNDGKNAYVANTGDRDIVVYAAGATSPSRTIPDPDGYPIECSFDPASAGLAVVNIINNSYGQGSIDIYRNATGKPHDITSKELPKPFSVRYDASGDLFIVGINSSSVPVLAELRANSKHIHIICPSLNLGPFPGALGWDGTYIVLGGMKGSQQGLFRIKGCKPIGFIPIGHVVNFYIDGNRIVVPDPGNASVNVYSYPKGKLLSTISGFSEPIGVTIVPSQSPLGRFKREN
jgi:hypothetical protein